MKSQFLFLLALVFLVGGTGQQAWAQDTYTLAIESPMGGDQNISGLWDSGSLTVKINNTFTKSFGFGQFSTRESLASGLAALIARECHGIASAKADGNVITFHLRYPAQAPLVIAPQTPQWDSAHFSTSSFQFGALTAVSQSVAALTLSSDHPGESVPAGTTVNFAVNLLTGNPSGTVDIYDNGQKFDTKTLVSSSASTSKVVSSGTHVFYARYVADSNYAASNSNSVYQTGTTAGPSAGAGLYSYDITNGYQADGNIHEYKDSVTGHWVAGYDALNRLTSHVAIADSTIPSPAYAVGRNNCWTYDSFGNMVAYGSSTVNPCPSVGTIPSWMTTIPYSVNNDNRIDCGPDCYDNAGNMRIVTGDNSIQSGVFYDGDGRVCATRQGGGGLYTTTVYVYDGSGNRVAEGTTDGSTSTPCDLTSPNFHQTKAFIVGPDGSQMTELAVDSSGGVTTWQHTSIMAGGVRATYNNDNGAETPAAGKLHFAVADWLGTRRLQTGYNGSVEGNWASLPYGNDEHCAFGCTATAATEHHFTGKERDDESGLDYFGARYLSSAMGRWTSPDWSIKEEPIPYADLQYPQSLNLYGYVKNNPLYQSDPDGHCCFDPNWTTQSWGKVKEWSNAHPRTSQAIKGIGKVGLSAATIVVAAASEIPSGGTATVGVIFAVQGATALGVSGVTDIVGAATKTDVSAVEKPLDAMSNPAGQVITAGSGDLNKGATAATVGDVLVGAANLKNDIKEVLQLGKDGHDAKAAVKATNIVQTGVNGAQEVGNQLSTKKPHDCAFTGPETCGK